MTATPPATAKPAGTGPELIYEVRDHVGYVTFNRPEARNALTFGMYDRLAEICRGIGDDGRVRVLVISGAGGKAFAAGTDISLFRSFKTPEQGLAYEKSADENFSAIEACPVPVIAAISGACTGGGAGIAACSDIRIATRDMKYGFPMARTLGNCLSAATLGRLVGLMGQAKVVEMLYTARLLDAEESFRIGLVSELHDGHDAVMARATAMAGEIAGMAPLTLRATKEILRRMRAAQPRVDDHDVVAKVYTSADFKEGMDAFLNKRKPVWTGR